MTMRHTELTYNIRDQLTLLALGALDPPSAQQWEAHLTTDCDVCRHEFANIQATMAMLVYSIPTTMPSDQLKPRLLSRIQDVAPDEPTPAREKIRESLRYVARAGWVWPMAFGAAASLLIASGVYINALRANIEQQRAQIADLNRDIAKQEQWLALWQSPQVNIVIMNGLDPSPQGHGKILWDPVNRKATLYVTNLPPTPQGSDYQLWQIVNNKPVSAGVFAVSADTGGFFSIQPAMVDDLKHISAFAVTLEPKGGVPQPTGKMFLLGKANL